MNNSSLKPMTKLEKVKALIGNVYYCYAGPVKIKKVRETLDGKILVYNENNWVCNVDILIDKDKTPVTELIKE